MTFNKAAFWGMKRRKALEKLLNHVRIPSNSGNHYYTVFFYNSTIQTPLIETIERLAKENGIPRTRVPALMAHELGFENSADYKKIQKGEKALEYWEAGKLMKLLGMKFEIKLPTNDDYYKFYLEGNRLVLEKKIFQKFKINFNIENWYDFEVDFSKSQRLLKQAYKQRLDQEVICKKLFAEVVKIINWYFLTQTGEKELPVEIFKIKALFESKFVKNETRHKPSTISDIKVD